MTTVAVRDGVMASDSRITGSFPDSTKKIFRGNGFIIGFSGDWVAGMHFVDRYIADAEPIRNKDDDVDFVILRDDGIYYMDAMFREVRISGSYYAIGSGSQAAMVAMNMGASAKDAVAQAIKVDCYSSAPIKCLELK